MGFILILTFVSRMKRGVLLIVRMKDPFDDDETRPFIRSENTNVIQSEKFALSHEPFQSDCFIFIPSQKGWHVTGPFESSVGKGPVSMKAVHMESLFNQICQWLVLPSGQVGRVRQTPIDFLLHFF